MPATVDGWTHGSQVAGMNLTNQPVVKINAPVILPPGFEGNLLSDESFADKATSSLPVDLAIGTYAFGRPAARVTRRSGSAVMPPTPVIDLVGRNETKGFMRTLLVVFLQPVLKPSLLGLWGSCGRSGGIRFEFPMPLFMRGIVSRPRPAAESGQDAQTDPPGTQLREPGRTGTGPRPPLIGMNPVRQAETTKQPYKFTLNARQFMTMQDAHAQSIAAVGIPSP